MIEAELLVKIPKMWITEMSKRHEVSIRVVNRRQSGKQGVRDLVEITGEQEELEQILKELANEPWVKSFDLDFVEVGKLMGEVVTHKCLALSVVFASSPRTELGTNTWMSPYNRFSSWSMLSLN